MMIMDGEITEIASPPNKADQFRSVSFWIPQTGEHIEMTFALEEFQRAGLAEGDQVSIKIEKKFDIDAMAQDLFKGKI